LFQLEITNDVERPLEGERVVYASINNCRLVVFQLPAATIRRALAQNAPDDEDDDLDRWHMRRENPR